MDDAGRRARLVDEVARDAEGGVGDLEAGRLGAAVARVPARRHRGANRQPGGIASARGSTPGMDGRVSARLSPS